MEDNKHNSLARMVAVSVISSAWYHQKAISLIQAHSSNPDFEQIWENKENQVLHDLNNLSMPLPIKKIFFDYYQPMGEEIRSWMQEHSFLNITEKTIAKVLCWNTLGAIDAKLTAAKILDNARADRTNFRLACMHSFKDDITRMWPAVKKHYEICFLIDSDSEAQVLFWVCYIHESIGHLMETMDYVGPKYTLQFAFWLAISTNNKVAAEFFLSTMKSEEKKRELGTTVKRVCETESAYNYFMLPFLILQSDTEQQDEFLRKYPQPILLHLLKWPYQYRFMEFANKTWSYLPARNFYRILDDIAYHVDTYDRSGVYHQIFKEFWYSAPLHCCEYVRNKCIDGTFLTRLSLLDYTACIMSTLIDSFTPEQKQHFIPSFNGFQLFSSLIKKQKWNMIHFIVDNCIPPTGREDWIDSLAETYSNAFEESSLFINVTADERDTFFRTLNALKDP